MSELVEQVRARILVGIVRVSEHGYDELAQDGLTAREAISGFQEGIVVEEYPNYPKGPCLLMLQNDWSSHSCCMGDAKG